MSNIRKYIFFNVGTILVVISKYIANSHNLTSHFEEIVQNLFVIT